MRRKLKAKVDSPMDSSAKGDRSQLTIHRLIDGETGDAAISMA